MAINSGPHAPAPYKVVLVEDEIVAREGIRDTVSWAACGFVFAGEAPDGEAALPLIEEVAPDVLITDIRMPFMDGLQLCRLVRERFPGLHVLILSGYDDFTYAQTAIQLGVVEYLLKPVSAHDLERALLRMREHLDREHARRADVSELASKAQEGLALRREELLRRVCLGDIDLYEALDQAREIELALSARAYAVVIARAHAPTRLEPQRQLVAQTHQAEICAAWPCVSFFRKDIEELVALVTGDNAEAAAQTATQLAEQLETALSDFVGLTSLVGVGDVRERLGDVPHSFAAAIGALDARRAAQPAVDDDRHGSRRGGAPLTAADAPRPNRRALERFLRQGSMEEFDDFFALYVGELENAALAARLYREYLVMDVTLAAAGFVEELGGVPREIVPEVESTPVLMEQLRSGEDVRRLARALFQRVLSYRDVIVRNRHTQLIQKARDFLERESARPDLDLHTTASEVGLSPSHFSALFSRTTGETFKTYLTRLRIERAQELLRSTSLPVAEVAERSGYSDPHYFSSAFRRAVGVSPREYRETVVL